MTLEVLSKPTPADQPMKSGGRSVGDREGGTDGFSTALSRAGKGSSDNRDGAGDGSTSHQSEAESVDTPATGGNRRSIRTAMQDAGAHAAVSDQAETTRASISSAFANAKGQVQRTANDEKIAADAVAAESDGEIDDAEVEVGPENTAVDKNIEQKSGESDLLSILAGLSPAAVAAASAGSTRSGPTGETRKATTAVGDGDQKSGIAADGKTARHGDAASAVLDMPTTDGADNRPAPDFKFINAKNGSVNAELTLAAKSGERETAEPKTAASSVENVMVLDSRRIVGLPSGSNGASLLAAMVGDQSWSAAMQPDAALSNIAAQSSSGSVVHMLKLQMNPHDLGAVTATLKMSGEQLHVHLTVETRAAMQQLSEDSSGMLDALRAQGFSVEQVTISVAPTADSNNQKGQQDAQTGQQMAGNGERQGGASQGQSGERFDETGDSRNFENDSSLDTSAAFGPGNSGGAGSGQLYL
ncbi:MAG: flagellar hook-length control protein FliK [Pseudorhizobium sp.]